MNVKTTIELPEYLLRRAERLVEQGQYPSVDSLVSAGLEHVLRSGEEIPEERVDAVLASMADEIRRRCELPADQFLEWNGRAMSARIKAQLEEMSAKSR